MATGKKKIVVYADWINNFESLNDEEAGRLIKHFFRYVNDLNPESDRLTELMFVPIKATLKRDLEKYQETCAKNAENGSKGGRPKKTELNPKKANGLNKNPNKAKKADSDNDSDNDIKTIPSIDDFIAYGLSLVEDVSVEALRLKYQSWLVNNWCTNKDGKQRKIKNWKSTLTNTITYLPKQPKQEKTADQELYENVMKKLYGNDTATRT